jgi:hypothetical protein
MVITQQAIPKKRIMVSRSFEASLLTRCGENSDLEEETLDNNDRSDIPQPPNRDAKNLPDMPPQFADSMLLCSGHKETADMTHCQEPSSSRCFQSGLLFPVIAAFLY